MPNKSIGRRIKRAESPFPACTPRLKPRATTGTKPAQAPNPATGSVLRGVGSRRRATWVVLVAREFIRRVGAAAGLLGQFVGQGCGASCTPKWTPGAGAQGHQSAVARYPACQSKCARLWSTMTSSLKREPRETLPRPCRNHEPENLKVFWSVDESGRPGSNRRRPAWEAGILPLNYARRVAVVRGSTVGKSAAAVNACEPAGRRAPSARTIRGREGSAATARARAR